MKKIYILLVLFSFLTAGAQIITFPDANFKARLLAATVDNDIASDFSGNSVKIDTNSDGQIEVSELVNIKILVVNSSNITDLTGITYFTNITALYCDHNLITNLSFSLPSLEVLICDYNSLSQLDLSYFPNLQSLRCSYNNLTNLDLLQSLSIHSLDCSHNEITSLDVGQNTNMYIVTLNNNDLHFVNFKTGSGMLSFSNFDFANNPNLQFICIDDFYDSVAFSNSLANVPGIPHNVSVSSYCSFVPGGAYYIVQGSDKYDSNNDGCDSSDIKYPNLKFDLSNGTVSGSSISNASGNYSLPLGAGSNTMVPVFENPTYFNISPTTATITFPSTVSPYTQNFCITANGTHSDLEVTLLPIGFARPGFDAYYEIVYKNKGTNTQSGSVNLAFNDAVLDYVSATPSVVVQTLNNLTWNFSNLAPFETRVIDVILNLNSPSETPPLNSGDLLNYIANINGLTDETPTDNASTLNQTVVNALDPNYKSCTEGTTITPSATGKYVHYMIGFENTGTANAQNIVVKDLIDTTKYDVASLVPIEGSAPFTTRIINTNQVEFIFENINLPFTTGSNDGFVAFKIKTKPTLVLGDTFSNTANIYFDYNAPIVTNTATTTIAALANPTFVFSDYFTLSPIPAKDILNITNKQSTQITSISIYNVLGQLILVTSNPSNKIDVSDLTTGSYFMKVVTEKGTSSRKFIKE